MKNIEVLQLDPVKSINIQVDSGGSLQAGNYRLAAIGRSYDSLSFNQRNLCSDVKTVDFNVKKDRSKATITFDAVENAVAYNIYLAKKNGDEYNFLTTSRYGKSNENTVTASEQTVNYTINDMPTQYGVDPFALFATMPGNIGRDVGSIFVLINKAVGINDIISELQDNYKKYFFWDGYNFILKGGIEFTENMTEYCYFNKLSIIAFQGGINSKGGWVEFGARESASVRNTKNGCMIYSGLYSYLELDYINLFHTVVHANINDYFNCIYKDSGKLVLPRSKTSGIMFNILLDNVALETYDKEPPNNMIINTSSKLEYSGTGHNITFLEYVVFTEKSINTRLADCLFDNIAINLITSAASISLKDCKFFVNNEATNYNVPSVRFEFDEATITLLASVNITTQPDTNILIIDSHGNELAAHSDSDGEVNFTIQYAELTDSHTELHTPYTLRFEKEGYQTVEITRNIVEKTSLEIPLTPNPAPINFSIRRLLSRIFASAKQVSSTELVTEGSIEHSMVLEAEAEITNMARATYRPNTNDILIEQDIDGSYVAAELISEGATLQRGSSSVISDPAPIYIDRNIKGEVSTIEIEGKVESVIEIKGEIIL